VTSEPATIMIIVWYIIPSKWLEVGWMHIVPVMQPVMIAKAIVEARKWQIIIRYVPWGGIDATKRETLGTRNRHLVHIILKRMTEPLPLITYMNW
jgi:hypothetical protein